VTSSGRIHVRRLLGAIRHLVRREVLPAVRHSLARCRDCEFRNYCRDVEVA
jgi:CRISPR/Cas system-associated exonuclease Cas4 (RecB family)